MSRYTNYGFGDPATWPPFSGNPNDPRAPDDVDEEEYDEMEDEDDTE
jgi:hypothetical protein